MSTPVGPLGSGLGGGVELTVSNLARVMIDLGHSVTVVTPAGEGTDALLPQLTARGIKVVQIEGERQLRAQNQERSGPVVTSSVLANMWRYARQHQTRYDLLVNFAYDWLPFFLTPFFQTPIAHFVSMGSLSDAIDEVIARVSVESPGRLGAYTRTQANSFTSDVCTIDWQILGSGLDMAQYRYGALPDDVLAWVGRISPEKGLEDAITAALIAQKPLKIFGKLEDAQYWQRLQSNHVQAFSDSLVEYCGFLSTAQLQQALGKCRALLVTPKWLEAFGIVAIEAMACGVPVIAYRSGGPAEIICSGKTGWLVEPDNVEEIVAAIANLDQIDRAHCRQQAASHYSLHRWGKRFESWFYQVVSSSRPSA